MAQTVLDPLTWAKPAQQYLIELAAGKTMMITEDQKWELRGGRYQSYVS